MSARSHLAVVLTPAERAASLRQFELDVIGQELRHLRRQARSERATLGGVTAETGERMRAVLARAQAWLAIDDARVRAAR